MATDKGILDFAADIRQRHYELQEVIEAVKEADGDWTNFSIAADDAMDIALNGLRSCLKMLHRIQRLAEQQKKKDTP